MPESSKRIRPCDACRRRKTKCVTEDGDSICVLCRFHAQACTYEAAPTPRRRGLAIDTAETSDSKRAPKRAKVVQTLPGTGVEEYDSLPGATLLRRTLGLQNLHHSRYIGVIDVLDVSSLRGHLLTADKQCDTPSEAHPVKVRIVSPLHSFQIIPDAATSGYGDERAALDAIEQAVGDNGPMLVRLFFRIIHPSLPVLHKDVFLEKYARSYREFSPPLLAAVYLLSSGYWRFSDELAGLPTPNLTDLEKLAWDSFRTTVRRPKLSTVQAGLLLAQYSDSVKGFTLPVTLAEVTDQVVTLAYGLGLHLDPTDWDIPEWEIGLRRRLSWAVFLQDKWSALLYTRPSRIRDSDWIVGDLTLHDFPETTEDDAAGSSEVQKGRLVFINMATLTVILNDILHQLLSARFRQSLHICANKSATLLEALKPLQIRLKDWFSSLPDSLKMDTSASMKLSSVGYLRLAYLTVETSLHRLLVETLDEAPLDPQLVGILRTAAKERFHNAVEFMQRLQALHLASFWYFTSARSLAVIHHFGGLLQRTAVSPEESAALGQKLKEFKWALKVSAEAGASFIKDALPLIELSSRAVRTTLGDQSATTSPSAARPGINAGIRPGRNVSEAWSEGQAHSVSQIGGDYNYALQDMTGWHIEDNMPAWQYGTPDLYNPDNVLFLM